MVVQAPFFFCLLLLGFAVSFISIEAAHLNRTSFPAGFIFGAGSSAYQCEGAANEDGRTPSVWDTFVKRQPGKILDGSTGNVADEFYHRYKEDVKLMQNIGLDSLRFSISWPRLLPTGRISGGVNQLGVDFYNNLINELLSKGIEPFVTLFVWDVPQALEDEYGGFLSHKIVNDFCEYANLCFEEFGDRVKYWVTVNEPRLFSSFGYAEGKGPPGRCSHSCYAGNSSTEPYIVQHHQLLAHASTVQIYRNKYKDSQKGKIGITEEAMWMVPKYNTAACRDAASRSLDFTFGWTVHPLVYGEYPESMRGLVGKRLPNFTKEESEMLIGSFDFLGVNYYTANYVEDSTTNTTSELSYQKDSHVTLTSSKNGVPIGQPTSVLWLFIYPRGILDLLLYVKGKYNNPIIYVTENGLADESTLPVEELLRDSLRITYHLEHLQHILKAMEEGSVDVRGYYVWSIMDDYEWDFGYTIRLGLHYVDFNNGLQRHPKDSALWFHNFLQAQDHNNISILTPTSTGFYSL